MLPFMVLLNGTLHQNNLLSALSLVNPVFHSFRAIHDTYLYQNGKQDLFFRLNRFNIRRRIQYLTLSKLYTKTRQSFNILIKLKL